MNVDGDGNQIFIEPDQGWTPAAGRGCDGAFAHPLFADELLDDLRDGAALESGAACEIGARDGLAGADDLQDDIAVDVPRGFA